MEGCATSRYVTYLNCKQLCCVKLKALGRAWGFQLRQALTVHIHIVIQTHEQWTRIGIADTAGIEVSIAKFVHKVESA